MLNDDDNPDLADFSDELKMEMRNMFKDDTYNEFWEDVRNGSQPMHHIPDKAD